MSDDQRGEPVGYSNHGALAPPAGYYGVRDKPLHRPPGVPALPAAECPHEAFAVRADINRVTDVDGPDGKVIGYDLEIAVDCVACMTPFEYMGLPLGMSPAHPTGTFDGLMLTAPVRPYGSHPDFGLSRPGFKVEMFVADDPAGREETES